MADMVLYFPARLIRSGGMIEIDMEVEFLDPVDQFRVKRGVVVQRVPLIVQHQGQLIAIPLRWILL